MKRLFLICGICIVSQVVVAQCKPTITLSISGCANTWEDRLDVKAAEAQANYYIEQMGIGFNSLQECNAFRNAIISISFGSGSCRVRYNVSPCMGCQNRAMGEANILAIGQGSSFYSINGANEIRDWSNDDMERMLALNKGYQDMTPSMLTTGDDAHDQRLAMLNDNNHDLEDYMIVGGARIPVSVLNKPFVSVNMREDLNQVEMANDFSYLANKENVQKYVDYCRNLSDLFMDLDNPYSGDFTMLLHQKFKEISGFDLDAIMQKLPSERTEAEKQALLDYQKFRKEVTDKIIADIDDRVAHLDEVKDFEMAALSGNSYKDSDGHYFPLTNYKEVNTYKGVNSDYLVGNQPIIGLSDLIDECNSTKPETGFHAELYYNEKTKEYTLAFEGTNFDEPADIRTDYEIGTNEVPEQYRLAYKIAKYLT